MEVRGARVPAAWNYGAVERALRDASLRGDACIFEPAVGKSFDSSEEAFEFMNMYSWEVGFGVRFGRSRTSKSGRRTMQDIVCACEGHGGAESARSVRCGCPAMVRLLRQADDSWAISRFVTVHNHPLSVGCGERRQWKSHNRIDKMTKDLVRHLRDNNVQISRVCNIVGSIHGRASYVPFSRQSIRSLCGRLAQESIEGDMAKTLTIFESMKAADPKMCLRIDLDEGSRVRSMFWAHGASKLGYDSFGDVVTFDTTYRTNLYNLPFGLFVGVNHHFQSVVFAAVLLTEETTQAFQWAFRTFVDVMGGEPKTILTDQCQAMRAAISTELPRTRHRWCRWHVLKKAKESLGPVYTKSSSFKSDLHDLLDQTVSIAVFESKWATLIGRYKLQGNQFLARAYENRRMWAKPYFADTFCAGMTSTQRSESANHVLKTYVPRAAPMHLFVSQYNRLITDKEADEGKEEHATKQVCRIMRVGVPIEHHASAVYTRKMFERFSKELFKSGSYKCYPSESGRSYRVVLISSEDNDLVGPDEYEVGESSDGSSMHCECKMFEHVGMPCRHMLNVLVHNGVKEIPKGLVLKRWTREARAGSVTGQDAAGKQVEADPASLHHIIYASAMELVSMSGSSRQAFDVGLSFVTRAKDAISSMTVVDPNPAPGPDARGACEDVSAAASTLSEVAAPPRVRSRGRPKEKRFKSAIESPGARKRKAPAKDQDQDPKCRAPNSRSASRKCRQCGSTDHASWMCTGAERAGPPPASSRRCRLCGSAGHNKSTCGRKTTYKATSLA
ncbi:hypothetical protein EJB05_36401, partial [Eragrostis curvula]